MAQTTSKFNWVFRYKVNKDDMTNLEAFLRNEPRGVDEGFIGGAVLKGLSPRLTSGLSLQVQAGLAVGPTGYFYNCTAASTVSIASPAGNPAKSLVVLRPLLVNSNPIVNPTNPTETIYLNTIESFELKVLNGTPAASPAYPATEANDVIIAGFTVTTAAAALTTAMFDNAARSMPRQSTRSMMSKTSSFSLDGTENYIQVDCTSAQVNATFPKAQNAPGAIITLEKTAGATGNPLVALCDAAESFQGASGVYLIDIGSSNTFYSDSKGWRVLV